MVLVVVVGWVWLVWGVLFDWDGGWILGLVVVVCGLGLWVFWVFGFVFGLLCWCVVVMPVLVGLGFGLFVILGFCLFLCGLSLGLGV